MQGQLSQQLAPYSDVLKAQLLLQKQIVTLSLIDASASLSWLWSLWQSTQSSATVDILAQLLIEDATQFNALCQNAPNDIQSTLEAQNWQFTQGWHTLRLVVPTSQNKGSLTLMLGFGCQAKWPQLLAQLPSQTDTAIICTAEHGDITLLKAVLKTLRAPLIRFDAFESITPLASVSALATCAVIDVAKPTHQHPAVTTDIWHSLGLTKVQADKSPEYLSPLPWLARQLDLASDAQSQINSRDKCLPRHVSMRQPATFAHNLPQPFIKTSIKSPHQRHIHIIGAGLAGSSCAWVLAQRGVNVTVWDKALNVAQGASSMPAGLFEITPSSDNNPLTQITRQGVRALLRYLPTLAPQFVNGRDWCDQSIINLSHRRRHQHIAKDDATTKTSGWLKPSKLVNALLHHPNIELRLNVSVDVNRPEKWLQQRAFPVTDVIITTGFEARLPQIHPVAGQVLWAPEQTENPRQTWPKQAINGAAYFIPSVPIPRENPLQSPTSHREPNHFWMTGATFDHDDTCATPDHSAHQRNWQRLQAMLPDVAAQIDFEQLQDLSHHARKGIRATTPDRMPRVGRMPQAMDVQSALALSDDDARSSVWVLAGLGSRGISLSLWCAEILCAQILGLPIPTTQAMLERIKP